MLAFSTVTNRGGLTLGAALIIAACSNSPTTTGSGTNPTGTPSGGATATPVATAGTSSTPAAQGGSSSATGGSSATTTTPTASAGKSGGTTPAATGGAGATATATAGSGASAGAGGAAEATAGSTAMATAGAGGGSASGSAIPLEDCVTSYTSSIKTDSTKKCGTFTTLPPQMTKIQLGPYGATSEYNVGKDFAITPNSSDTDGGATCQVFAAAFAEDQQQTDKLLATEDLDFGLYTIYYPVNPPSDLKLPIITWGNGTCAQPEGYGALLRYVASYGYFIVAPNSRWVGGADPKSNKMPMSRALDYAFAENDNKDSKFYQRLDTTNVGAMGHSQGGMATLTAASDDRVKAIINWNGGNTAAKKPWLEVSADRDVFVTSPMEMDATSKSSPPSAWLYFHNPAGTGSASGHLVLMTTPDRVIQQAVAWWDMELKQNADAKATFVGATCKWCGHMSDMNDSYEFGANGIQ